MVRNTKTKANAAEFSMSDEELMDSAKEQKEQLVKETPIDVTPFKRLEHKGKLYLALGKYRLSEGLETEEELKNNLMNIKDLDMRNMKKKKESMKNLFQN